MRRADQWLYVMERAHNLCMRTTATKMFGHEEEPRHRLDHLFAVREVQDRTHGFTAFIPWTFQPAHTRINVTAPLPAPAYLRLLAVSRLVLDNIPNIQSSWVTMGPEVAQLALFYGANDFGSLMIEENVVAAAGVDDGYRVPMIYQKFAIYDDNDDFTAIYISTILSEITSAAFSDKVEEETAAYAVTEDASAVKTYSPSKIRESV